eukprot:1388898-Prymnesium_polylepis.1
MNECVSATLRTLSTPQPIACLPMGCGVNAGVVWCGAYAATVAPRTGRRASRRAAFTGARAQLVPRQRRRVRQ